VHFYSKFLRKKRSIIGTQPRFEPHRTAPRPRAPCSLGVRAPARTPRAGALPEAAFPEATHLPEAITRHEVARPESPGRPCRGVLRLRRRTEPRAQPLAVRSLTWRASPIKGSAALCLSRRVAPALHSTGAVGGRRGEHKAAPPPGCAAIRPACHPSPPTKPTNWSPVSS
jgi:hypothetical protein